MSDTTRSLRLGDMFDLGEKERVILCSYMAASCSLFVGYPLDTIKTRLQTYRYPNFWHCIKDTYLSDGGIYAFYRGIAATLLSASAARAFTMSMYNALLPELSSITGVEERRFPNTFISGVMSGAVSTLFTCPFEFTKTASQVEALVYRNRGLPPPKHKGSLQAVKDLSRRGGLFRLYGGWQYQVFRDGLGSGLYFAVYETVKSRMNHLFPLNEQGKVHPLSVAVAGGSCGVISWIAVYPIDTLKSKYQRDLYNHSLANSLEFRDKIVERPKLRLRLSMYRGLGFSILRTSLNGMVLFTCYEYFMHVLTPSNELE